MQQITFIDLFKSALHVSGDKFAHPQEHFGLYIQLSVQRTDTAADRCMAPIGSSVGEFHQKVYIQSKVLLRMGELVARNI
jgi:hypothetical protein